MTADDLELRELDRKLVDVLIIINFATNSSNCRKR